MTPKGLFQRLEVRPPQKMMVVQGRNLFRFRGGHFQVPWFFSPSVGVLRRYNWRYSHAYKLHHGHPTNLRSSKKSLLIIILWPNMARSSRTVKKTRLYHIFKGQVPKKKHKKWLNSLPESNSKFGPEKRPKPKKERIVFQASVFSFYVSFREAKSLKWLMVWDLTPYLPQNAIVTATTRIEIYVFLCEFLLGLPVALSTFTGMEWGWSWKLHRTSPTFFPFHDGLTLWHKR